jgi:CubicO group peptidase (beta-lactamase class C family)
MGRTATRNLPIVSKKGEFHSIRVAPVDCNFPRSDTGAAPSADPDWLAATLAELADTHHVPGAQLAVHRGGVTVAVEIGEQEHSSGIPLTTETAFPTGSLCKVATATLAMILVGDGDLELDAPLEEHLPELDGLGSELTLNQLLSHTSGLPSSPDTQEWPALSLGRYVRKHCGWQNLILPPGSAFSYSNLNYVVIGHLIETITRMNWSEAVESILLRPLGIEATMVGAMVRTLFGRPIATGHSVNAATGRTRPVEQSIVPAEAPGVGLAMSAVDLVALGRMHIGSGFPELLPAAHAEQMRQAIPGVEPFGLADGWGAGLAVFQGETTTWVGHDGNANGTSCYLRIDPANEYVLALTTNANTGSSMWEELRSRTGLANPTLSRYQSDGSFLTVASPAEFVGSYVNGPTEFFVTAGDEGGLFLEIGGELVARLAFYDDRDFLIQDPISGQGHQIGRFLRDSITQQVECVQIGGRLAPRRGLAVPEARSSSESVSRVSV